VRPSQIVFFLMGAMTIVEVVDAHNGFEVITQRIRTTRLSKLMWLVGFVTFFLSALLDNLTTTIVMISLMRKLLSNQADRLFFAGIIVIAANAGGAWSPIGDVTTTMLWIGGQITTMNIILRVPALRGQPAGAPGNHRLRVARPSGRRARAHRHGSWPEHHRVRAQPMFLLGSASWSRCRRSRPSPTCRPSWASCSAWASSGWWATWCTATRRTIPSST
jgi:hypothetical protein